MNTTAWYRCVDKRCRDYGKEFPAAMPAVVRQATGRHVACRRCGGVVQFVRTATTTTTGGAQ